MSREAARVEIVTAIEALKTAWTGGYTPVIDYDNRELVNIAGQTNPYLSVELVYLDGQQMDLGPQPLVGTYGQIWLAVLVKRGKGTSQANALMDYFEKGLQLQRWTLVSTQVKRPQPARQLKENYALVSLIDFWYHETS